MTLRDIHVAGAWFVIGANAVVGAWALGAHYVERLRSRALWWAVIVAEVGIFVQIGFGVAAMKVDHLQPQKFHEFYGFVALFTVAIIYSYRTQLRDRLYLLYGLGSLFLMGLAIRAFYLSSR
ncbi:MAG TPA: hypothetical protein VGH94_06620 [Acidimicrobiales bacterium]